MLAWTSLAAHLSPFVRPHLSIRRPTVFSDENLQRYARALYPVGFVLLLVPIMDLTLRSMPPQFGTLQWRFATVGLLLGNYGTILLGAGLVGLVAAISGHRTALRVLGIASVVMAVLTVAALLMFVLDAVQIRRLAAANFKRPILMSSLGALFTGGLGTIAWVVLGRGALAASRGGRAAAPAARGPVRAAASPLVVGAAPAAPAAAAPTAVGDAR
jgi:hypothetical protein